MFQGPKVLTGEAPFFRLPNSIHITLVASWVKDSMAKTSKRFVDPLHSEPHHSWFVFEGLPSPRSKEPGFLSGRAG